VAISYTYLGKDLFSNYSCIFCSKNDIFKNMYIATLDSEGKRVFPIDPNNVVFLCKWCAHFDSKLDMENYTNWLLNQLIYKSLNYEIDTSYYNGVL